eukprot:2059504-Rhodomonas_salina.1
MAPRVTREYPGSTSHGTSRGAPGTIQRALITRPPQAIRRRYPGTRVPGYSELNLARNPSGPGSLLRL